MKRNGNSHNGQLRRIEARIRQTNRRAAKGIQENVYRFSALADAAERDLRKLQGVGKGALRAFRTELKRSWRDLKRVAHEQF